MSLFRPNLETKADTTLLDNFVYDVQGDGNSQIEHFKAQVMMLHKTMQFTKWAEEEAQAE